MAYTSSKFTQAEVNYATTEQELLVSSCASLAGMEVLEMCTETELLADHNPLVYLQMQKMLYRRQARWMEILSRFPFAIKYTPGKTHMADLVSRNPLLYEEETPTDVISVAAGLLGAVVAVCAGIITRGRALREARNQEGEGLEIELSLPQVSTPNLEPGGGECKSATQSLGTPCDREWTAGAYHDEGGSLPLRIKHAVQEFTQKLKMRDGIWMLGCKKVVPQDKAFKCTDSAALSRRCHEWARTWVLLRLSIWCPGISSGRICGQMLRIMLGIVMLAR